MPALPSMTWDLGAAGASSCSCYPTGRYALREYPLVNFGRDERVFLAAVAVAQWKAAA